MIHNNFKDREDDIESIFIDIEDKFNLKKFLIITLNEKIKKLYIAEDDFFIILIYNLDGITIIIQFDVYADELEFYRFFNKKSLIDFINFLILLDDLSVIERLKIIQLQKEFDENEKKGIIKQCLKEYELFTI